METHTLADGEVLPMQTDGQRWLVSWHPPTSAPVGKPHGSAGICVTPAGDIVLISGDGRDWDLPAGRPEGDETWEQTLRREMYEEACAVVGNARLLGFCRSQCVRGHEAGMILVRSFWRADVILDAWHPLFETHHRQAVPASDVMRHLPVVYAPILRRALREAGFYFL